MSSATSPLISTSNQPVFQPPRELAGDANFEPLGLGLKIRSTRWRVLKNVAFENIRFTPALRVIFLLSGHEHLQIGSVKIDMDATEKPVGLWLPIGREAVGRKFFLQGETQNEFIFFVSNPRLEAIVKDISHLPTWFGTGPEHHLRYQFFDVTHQMEHLIGNARSLTDTRPLLERLQQESIVLDLFQSVCRQLFTENEAKLSMKNEAKRSVNTLLHLLQSGKADDMSLEEMAKVCGSNVTSLQRHFKQAHGLSIWHYLRKLKLERAHKALLMGASVSVAAEIAGYRHLESFTKAFKTCFNSTPRQVKPLS